MSDALRPLGSGGWIPRPQSVQGAARRPGGRSRDDSGGRDSDAPDDEPSAFEFEPDDTEAPVEQDEPRAREATNDATLQPQRRRDVRELEESARGRLPRDPHTPNEEGLGGDLDLLA